MIDCHAHIMEPARFPYGAATYRPGPSETGTLEQYLATLDAHGVSQALLVQPTSGYDTDHRCLFDAWERARHRLRLVVRIPPGRARQDAGLLDRPGVAGVRLDVMKDGMAALADPDLPWLLGALRERKQVLQVQVEGDQLAQALPAIRDAGVRIVVDHCGRPDPARGPGQPGFAALLELGREGHFVKACGAFRFSREPYPHADVAPFVAALLEAFTPARCVWGSDWPFLRLEERPRYEQTVALWRGWLGDLARLDAPARSLFGFADSAPVQ